MIIIYFYKLKTVKHEFIPNTTITKMIPINYANIICNYLEKTKDIDIKSRFMNHNDGKLDTTEVFHYMSWLFMNKMIGNNNIFNLDKHIFKYHTGAKYYQYGGSRKAQGYSEDEYIMVYLSVKHCDEDDSKYIELYKTAAICG